MAITITKTGEAGGGASPVLTRAGGMGDVTAYQVAFDDSYPTGGESISAIWDDFKDVYAIFVQNHNATIAANRLFLVDLTNKKLLVLTDATTQATNASDQSAVTDVKLLVVGTLK